MGTFEFFYRFIRLDVRLVHVQEDLAGRAKAEDLSGRERSVYVAAERLHVHLVERRPQATPGPEVPAGTPQDATIIAENSHIH